jgi:hypothetical protein
MASKNTLYAGFFLFLGFASVRVARSQDVEEGGIKDRDAAIRFCKDLQLAVKSGEKSSVAGWINGYPIEVQHGAKSFLIADDTDFIKKFDLIFDTETRNAVLGAGACEMPLYPNGSAKIAEGKIEIDQAGEESKTYIFKISPPPDYASFFADNDVYEAGAKEFFGELRKAVSADNRRSIANLCRYPLSVNVGGKHREIKNRAELIAEYTTIFRPAVKHAVLTLQAPIHVGWHGFMTDRGELWLDLVVGTHVYRIGTVNGGYLPVKNKQAEH